MAAATTVVVAEVDDVDDDVDDDVGAVEGNGTSEDARRAGRTTGNIR